MLPWIQKIPAFIPHQSPAFPEPPLPLPSPKLHSLPLFHSVFVVCASESVGGEVNIWSLCLWNWKVPPSRGWRRGGFVSFALSGSYIKTFLFQRISSLFFRVQYFPCMQILLDTWFIIYIYFYIYAIFQTIGFPPYSNDWLMMQRIWQVNKGGKTIYATSHTLQIVNLVLISWEIILPRKVIVLLCKIFPYYFIYIFLIIVCDKLLPDIIVFFLQSVDELVLRDFNYCVIDEVDSILIDEARTPLIISGPAERPSDRYYKAAKIATAFERDIHYTVRNST